ncbi:RNA polymerase II C-terminal domain phosphatase-like 4 [Silene latifolia]|uniref:RNA polymerase II C-terminal domain phosphatase-like 4 n=1 Tax=Silene latifolia TaxID=37657 RepID=UPI003D76BBD7
MNPPCKAECTITCFFTCIGKTKTKKKDCEADKPYHNINRNFSLSVKEINRTRELNLRSLIKRKKLHLLLDLDNTLIHAIRVNRLSSTDRDYLRYIQREIVDGGVVNPAYIYPMLDYSYALKMRPGVKEFLMELSPLFDISIYTLAGRSYAKVVAEILDPYKCTFRDIITNENCTTPGYKGLDVVLYPERVTVIVDDLREVWKKHPDNLIQIRPYEFFDYLSLGLGVEELVKHESTDMDTELLRVLIHLKKLHAQFYKEKTLGHSHRDIRKFIIR